MVLCKERETKLYQDKDWLQNKYNNVKLSGTQIGLLCNKSSSTITRWRKRFKIVSRSLGEGQHLATGNHCNLSPEAMEWINGEMLGDGSLNSLSSYSASFYYDSSKKDYTKYVSNTLKSFGIKQAGRICKRNFKINTYDPYIVFYYCSLRYAELLPIYRKWYPQGKKIVPRDLILTPLTCRQWYIGDGSLSQARNWNPSIQLHTCGFPIPDVKWLVEQLINLGFKTTRWNVSNTIHISTKSTKDFLNYIGPCPVQCYQYKWNYYKEK